MSIMIYSDHLVSSKRNLFAKIDKINIISKFQTTKNNPEYRKKFIFEMQTKYSSIAKESSKKGYFAL